MSDNENDDQFKAKDSFMNNLSLTLYDLTVS